MIHEAIADFLAAVKPGRALIGLDLGTKTIGVAVSDRLLSVASPLETIRRKKFTEDAHALLAIAAGREVFRPLAGYDYAKPPHPGVLFYQRFQWVWPRHPRVDYTKADEVCAALMAFRREGEARS